MRPHARCYERLAALLEYPDEAVVATAEQARRQVAERSPEAAAALEELASGLASLRPWEREELYTRTFDLLAPWCLDIGYQLFGEAYQRGSFLVKMRAAVRRHGVETGAELPDHLAVVLRLLARLPDEEDPRGLCEEAILPAVQKMLRAFPEGENPYAALLRAVRAVLCADFRIEVIPPTPDEAGGRRKLPIVDEGGVTGGLDDA